MNEHILALEDRDRITSLCRSLGNPLSEYNFPNLYLFRTVHTYRMSTVRPDLPAIIGRSYDGHTFLMPLFRPVLWRDVVDLASACGAEYIFPIPERWLDDLGDQGFSVSFDERDSDYVYATDSIRTYAGRHFDGPRNFVHRLTAEHRVSVRKLSKETEADALCVLDRWAGERDGDADENPCREAIVLADALGLDGYIYDVDGRPSGIFLGGALSEDTYLFHFAKALSTYRGLTKFCYQDIAGRIDPRYVWLNWEQDLGIAGLRKAKRSFCPACLARKGRLHIPPQS